MLTSVECWNVSRRHTNNQQARLADALQGFPFTSDRETDANDWWSKFESGGGGDGGGGGWIDADVALEADESFSAIYSSCYAARMQLRLGLRATGTGTVDDAGIAAGSDNVVDGWLQWLKMTGADYALSSRVLAEVDIRTGSARSAGSAANGAENDQLLAVAAQKVAEAGGVSAVSSKPEQVLLVEMLRLLQSRIATTVSSQVHQPASATAFRVWSQTIRAAVPRTTLRSFHVRKLLSSVVSFISNAFVNFGVVYFCSVVPLSTANRQYGKLV